jgi:hypothetical protein
MYRFAPGTTTTGAACRLSRARQSASSASIALLGVVYVLHKLEPIYSTWNGPAPLLLIFHVECGAVRVGGVPSALTTSWYGPSPYGAASRGGASVACRLR